MGRIVNIITCFHSLKVYLGIVCLDHDPFVKNRWAGHAVRMGEKRSTYRDLVGKPERTMPLGCSRPRWEGNSKMDL